MRTSVRKSYDITVYPYDDGDQCSFVVKVRQINERTLRIILSILPPGEHSLLLGICENILWFIDQENCRGITMKIPRSPDEAYSYFEEISDYDEEECSILSETVYLLYHDILSKSAYIPYA